MTAHDDYAATYRRPADVLTDETLDDAAKRRILEQWRLDAKRRQASSGEGMGGGYRPRLSEVDQALRDLDA